MLLSLLMPVLPDPTHAQSYTLMADQEFLRLEEVPPAKTFKSTVVMDADGTMVIEVSEEGRTIASSPVTAACASPSPSPSGIPSPSRSAVFSRTPTPVPTPTPSVTRRAPVVPPSPPAGPQPSRRPSKQPSRQPSKQPSRRAARSRTLPFTGSGDQTMARAATGLAVIVFGGLLVFYGLLWPRDGCGDWQSPLRRTR